MQRQLRQDTRPELALRRELHRRGWRYRVHFPVLDGRRRKVDVAFTRRKVAVLVDGCFWHACPLHGTLPQANGEWWRDKLTANQRRDRDTDARLRQAGWTVLRIWEHEDVEAAADRVEAVLSEPT